MTKTVLILRTCNAKGTSYNNFQWPKEGPVQCPNWDPEPKCGYGLHGLLWGEGNAELLNWSGSALWQVVEVKAKDIVTIENDKVKFPCGIVLYSGNCKEATDLIMSRAPAGTVCHSATVVVGDKRTAIAGYYGQATAGDYGQAIAGYYGHATAGDYGQAIAGVKGHATAGNYGHATAGYDGHATAGDKGHATAGNYGHATAGYDGHATAGNYGHATAGYDGQATAGYQGQATAGNEGTIQIQYYSNDRYRWAIGYVGENGIKANTWYKCTDKGQLVEK